jgi:hypothetical protein
VSLLEQQNVLARLITDPGFRKQFLSNPDEACRRLDLTQKEIEDLLKVGETSLSVFAESLVWKRLREVEKLLPITRQMSGEKFRGLFFEFAPTFNPHGVKKHYEDAIRFGRFIEERDMSEPARDAARFERTRLTFFNENRAFAYCRSRYKLAKAFGSGHDASRRKRTAIAVWLRLGKRVFHFVI